MLKDDPPSGTTVRVLGQLRKAKTNDIATLIRPLGIYKEDRPEDAFEIEFQGERMVVERRDIE